MISYLSGKIILRKDNFIILEVNGVGYEVFVSANTVKNMPAIEQNLKLFCYLDVGERSLRLFGFLTFDELELFKLMRAISGVGPKAALEIASAGPIDKIKQEIKQGDIKFLDNITGIGKKKAQKIILELSGKFKVLPEKAEVQKDKLENDQAFLALLNLGFSKEQARKALIELPADITDSQQKIKQALQILGQ